MNVFDWATNQVRAWLNPGEEALNVPPLEGALKPNEAIERAEVMATLAGADAVAVRGSQLVFSAGSTLCTFDGGAVVVQQTFPHSISALAALADGSLAIALDGYGLRFVGGPRDGAEVLEAQGAPLRSITDLTVWGDDLILCQGSLEHRAEQWQHNLMGKRRDGRLVRLALPSLKTEVLADRLGWPAGATVTPQGELLVSLAWEHRLARLVKTRALTTAWKNMPGYPGRLRPARAGGYWLPIFAMRTKLVEFVLQEDEYRTAMMEQIEPKYWVAPALAALDDHWEPLQGGGIKQLGISKPWAPPRSYGLIVRLDANAEPLASLHSRSNARRHGVTGVVEHGEQLVFTSRGNGLVLKAPLAEATR